MKSLFKILFSALGAGIFLNGVALFFVSNINLGNFLTVGFGAVILLLVLFFKKLGNWLKVILLSAIGTAVVFSSFLIIYGKTDTATYEEDAIIVLGAAVHGKTPSLTLKKRLDTAAKYLKHNSNPNAVIIVSGGQGNGEDISEAEAMQNYLIKNHSIPQERIIKEDKSTSTAENFAFSKEILDERFSDNYTAVFVTNEYHILRAGLCAKRAGFETITHLHSNTNFSYLVSGVLRECLAVVKYVIFKN